MACEDCDHEHSEHEIRLKAAIESLHHARDKCMRNNLEDIDYNEATEVFNYIMEKVNGNDG